jgi:hypothetical protein
MSLLTDREAREWIDRANDAEAEVERLREVLERIAMPTRPDGTYNLSREACEQIARKALNHPSLSTR